MTNEELELIAGKLAPKLKGIPGLDLDFLKKCLSGINTLDDPTVEDKLKQLIKFC